MAKKNCFISWMDDLPWIVKIIFCIPALDFLWAIYRIVKGVCEEKPLTLIAGVVWIIGAISIGWILDIVWMIMFRRLLFA